MEFVVEVVLEKVVCGAMMGCLQVKKTVTECFSAMVVVGQNHGAVENEER